MDAAVRVAVPVSKPLHAAAHRGQLCCACTTPGKQVNGEVQIKEYHQFSKSIQMRQDFANKGIV